MEIPLLVKKAYHVLGLVSFFTTGEDETRAWTIERGTKAPQASGVIHTDFESKFIRLEVVPTEKLLEAGGWSMFVKAGRGPVFAGLKARLGVLAGRQVWQFIFGQRFQGSAGSPLQNLVDQIDGLSPLFPPLPDQGELHPLFGQGGSLSESPVGGKWK